MKRQIQISVIDTEHIITSEKKLLRRLLLGKIPIDMVYDSETGLYKYKIFSNKSGEILEEGSIGERFASVICSLCEPFV